MIERRGAGSPGVTSVVHHHAPCIRRVAAPMRRPSRIASPVLVLQPALQAALVGLGRYCSRMAWLCSNPPAASTTPRRARMRQGWPDFSTTAPTTAPASSVISSRMGVSRQIGTPRSFSDNHNRVTPAQPVHSRRAMPHFSSQGSSTSHLPTRRAVIPTQPGWRAMRIAASDWVKWI